MASNDNPVSRLNEFCQRNKLTLSFEKINDNQLCLTIGRQGFQEYIQFTGEGRTLKLAKCDAAERAFKAGIINELKKVAAGESAASRSGDLVARFGRFTLKDGGQDPIYEAYLVARAHNLPFFIEFRNVRRGVSQTKLSVIVRLGNTKTEGLSRENHFATSTVCGALPVGNANHLSVEQAAEQTTWRRSTLLPVRSIWTQSKSIRTGSAMKAQTMAPVTLLPWATPSTVASITRVWPKWVSHLFDWQIFIRPVAWIGGPLQSRQHLIVASLSFQDLHTTRCSS